ncbi:multiubiquitin domain-containing protein [Mesorhizobium sp. MSK_1335]|uniref:Multiubiquitin domain-containing protein n=1 Tax=Mesorhizobium montanum TaxID=3072323 RepID=A0ABU4ZRL1_9HYPH|nr:multiubiquitin domain-containing protein [Mesorhizobium sp. MSK_1335]MDX8528047.1 multiubiquitin domain-containing protein [Mesorhizobium sp. MSK_1335]
MALATAGAKDDHPKFSINIDGVHFEVQKESITGAELKQIAGKDAQYQLFLEGHGHDSDRQIGDTEAVTLKNGMHFYTVPPATFG